MSLSFNRTILELKQIRQGRRPVRGRAFNRTILELKPGVQLSRKGLLRLLTVPFWN